MTVQRDQQVGDSFLLNTFCSFNRVLCKGGSKLHSIALENICVCRMVLKHDSEEETAFLLSVSEELSQLNFSSLDSTAGLDLLSEAISELFANCWATYAKKIIVTTWSKEWWNNE